MNSIKSFKKGDIITQIYRALNDDGSYLGDEIYYIGVVNNQIYGILKDDIFGTREIKLNIDNWDNIWDYYKNPRKLLDSEILDLMNINVIENYLRTKKLKKS